MPVFARSPLSWNVGAELAAATSEIPVGHVIVVVLLTVTNSDVLVTAIPPLPAFIDFSVKLGGVDVEISEWSATPLAFLRVTDAPPTRSAYDLVAASLSLVGLPSPVMRLSFINTSLVNSVRPAEPIMLFVFSSIAKILVLCMISASESSSMSLIVAIVALLHVSNGVKIWTPDIPNSMLADKLF